MKHIQRLEVASDLGFGEIAAIFWRRKWIVLAVLSFFLGATYLITQKMKKQWSATAQLIMVQPGMNMNSLTDPNANNPVNESVETQSAMITSSSMRQRTYMWLKEDCVRQGKTLDDIGMPDTNDFWNERKFLQYVTVNVPKETNLIEVSVSSSSPEKATRLADAVSKAFIDWKRDLAQGAVRESIENLKESAQNARQRLNEAEQREKTFKEQHKLVDVPTQHQAKLAQYLSRDAEVATLKQDLASQEVRLKAIEGRLRESNLAIKNGTGVRDDAMVLSLQSELTKMEMDRVDLAQKYTPQYLGVLPNIDAKILDVKERLTRAVQGTLDNQRPSLQTQGALVEEYDQAKTGVLFTRARFQAAVGYRNQLNGELAGVPETSLEYARLQHDSELRRGLSSALQSRLNAAQVTQQTTTGNVQIAAEPEQPQEPILPDLTKNMVMGGMAGLGLSLLCALLIEHSDHRIRSVSTARGLLPGPILGAIPRLSRSQLRKTLQGETPWTVREAYAISAANLAVVARQAGLGDVWQGNICLISSAVPGEGKSFTSMHLARSLARTGRSVILVDADMRRPSINRLFNTDEPVGLANVLYSERSALEALVASDTDNLSILHSGTPKDNPSELIARPQMREVLSTLRQAADVVIVDAPACTVVADTLLLALSADIIVHVVGMGQTDEDTLMQTTEALMATEPKLMAFLINRAPRKRAYGHYYSRTEADAWNRAHALGPAPDEMDGK